MRRKGLARALGLAATAVFGCSADRHVNLCAGIDCGDHGDCGVVAGATVCVCTDDYSGPACEIPAVCVPNPCVSPHQTRCAGASGAAICLCDDGYHDDGAGACAPIAPDGCAGDPCAEPHRSTCAHRHVAVCLCDDGYLLDEGECAADPEGTMRAEPVQRTASRNVRASGDTAICACDEGFRDEGGACASEDVCEPNPCNEPHRSECSFVGGTLVCACDAGYHDSGGGACVVDDPCDPNPCLDDHRGVCTADAGEPECSCDSGHIEDPESTACIPDTASRARAATRRATATSRMNAQPKPRRSWWGRARAHHQPSRRHRLARAHDRSRPHLPLQRDRGWRRPLRLSLRHERRDDPPNDRPRELHVRVRDGGARTTGRVQAASSTATGSYSVTIADLGLDDHGDVAAAATPIEPETEATSGNIETWADGDVFAFTPEPGHIYDFTATEDALDLYVWLSLPMAPRFCARWTGLAFRTTSRRQGPTTVVRAASSAGTGTYP